MKTQGSVAVCGRTFFFTILLVISALITACGAPGGAASAEAEAGNTPDVAGSEASEEPPSPTSEPTQEAAPTGKLLDACALIPADEVEAFQGTPITGNTRLAIWVPHDSQGYGNQWTFQTTFGSTAVPTVAERMVYECYYDVNLNRVWISVEVFAEPTDAAEQMDSTLARYNANLRRETIDPIDGSAREEGMEPMIDVSGLGDRAYGFDPNAGAPMGYYPTIYFLSGNYLVRIGNPFVDEATYEWTLDVAQNAISSLPADIHSLMADQGLSLDSLSQPAGKLLEPCELITRGEAQVHLLAPIVEEESSTLWPGLREYNCSYRDATSQGRIIISVALPHDMEYWTNEIESSYFAEVGGVGDRAFRGVPSRPSGIAVITGEYVITINVINGAEEETRFQSAMELAEIVVTRLP